MKKILVALLILLTLTCVLCACSDVEEHTHDYSIDSKKAEYVKSEATCTSGTVIYYSCLCGEKGSETFELDNKTHNISKTYTDTNTLYHTTKVTCRDCSAVVSETLELHSYFNDKNCEYCDHRKKTGEFKSGLYQSGTENLLYTWDELISEGILTVKEEEISESDSKLLVGDLIISDTMKKISDMAFMNCDQLTRVSMPISIRSVGAYAFADCDTLENVILPANLYSIGGHAFYSCDSFTIIEVPNSITALGAFAFANCKNVKTVTLGNATTTLGRNSLAGLHSLTQITLPASVEQIDAYALSGCYDLVNIEYRGTVEEWNEIKKDTYWAEYPNEYKIICTDGEVAK